MSVVVEEHLGPLRTDGFADQSKRYSYLVSCEVARMMRIDPNLVEAGRRHLETFSRNDPAQRFGYELWDELLRQPVDAIAARLTERSERGDYARETKPCFAVVPVPTRQRLMEQARRPLGLGSIAGDIGSQGEMVVDLGRMDREKIGHLLRAAREVTGESAFVLIGSAAAIARCRPIALELMATREIDVYVQNNVGATEQIGILLGELSQFDNAHGYYADGVGPKTAHMPEDWENRAKELTFPNAPGVVCICPDVNDIALSKLCAWREKDQKWLVGGLTTGLLNLKAMRERVGRIVHDDAPTPDERIRRLDHLAALLEMPGAGNPVAGRTEAGPARRVAIPRRAGRRDGNERG